MRRPRPRALVLGIALLVAVVSVQVVRIVAGDRALVHYVVTR